MSRRWLVVAVVPLLTAWSGCLGEGESTWRAGQVFSFQEVARGDAAPEPFAGCGALLEELNARALDEARVHLEQSVANGVWRTSIWDDVGVRDMAASSDAAPESAQGASAAGAQVTGTNNQEAGADEGDLVKTDGEWTYVLSRGTLHILHSEKIGDVAPHSRTKLGAARGGELLLVAGDPDDESDDRLVVVLPDHEDSHRAISGSGVAMSDAMYYPVESATRVLVLSLADRRDPEIIEEFVIDGLSHGARLVGSHGYVVVHRQETPLRLETGVSPYDHSDDERWSSGRDFHRLSEDTQTAILTDLAREADERNQARIENLTLSDHVPRVSRTADGETRPLPLDAKACRTFWTNLDSTGRGVTTILALDLAGAPGFKTTQVVGGRPIVYASEDALVLAAPSQDTWWFWAQPELVEATDLQWFALDGMEVTPRASGRVLGTVLDSFSLDVEGDELRVATTTGTWGRWWLDEPEPMMSHVAVFRAAGGVLVQTGIVGGIAPGERIWSARFTEDRAYLVTFRQTDPLWVIDLSSARPTILGELEIPGVSTYIHPLDEKALLTIGIGPQRGGQGLDWGRIQVSLFNISDPGNPTRADVLNLSPGGDWSWSGAVHEHKAFTYWADVGTLAVPVTTSRSERGWEDGRSSWVYDHHVSLRLVRVDRAGMNLWLRGEIAQNALLGEDASWAPEIQRSYFLGYPETGPVSVYAISQLGITSHDLATLRPQDQVPFPPGGP